jgi:ATP-dependent RNA helicase DOB1
MGLEPTTNKDGKGAKSWKGNDGGRSDIYKIVKMIMEWKFQPELFSILVTTSKLDFNSEEEK